MKSPLLKFLFLIVVLNGCYHVVSGYRILSVFLLCGRSSMNYFDAIHLELAKRGHMVTVISPTPGLVKHQNIQEFPGVDFKKLFRGMSGSGDYFKMRLAGERMSFPFSRKMSEKFASDCDAFYQLPAVQHLIQDAEASYDLVMTMAFMNECVYGLFDFLNTSSIIIGATPTMPWFVGATGTPTLTSFVPHIYFPASHLMTFYERLGNLASLAYQLLTRSFVYAPQIESVYRKYIPNAADIASVESNVSMFMGAGHPSFGPLRPSMPNLIDDIGGIHCRPANPLPKDIMEMITDSNSGGPQDFIFFSLGSIVQSHQVPDHIRTAFLTAFGKLAGNFQILWKWEEEDNRSASQSMSVPENVKLSKWYPQQDLLGHPNCKLCITHGGLSSLHEALYHSVPVLGIPFFGDQDWNMRQVEYHGIGETLELAEISEETLTKILEKMLSSSKYTENVKYRSKLFRDRQVSALDTAVWNIEYVLRHGGATHLQSPARNMNVIQHYSVDVIIFVLGVLIVTLLSFVHFCQGVCKILFSKKKNKKAIKMD